MCGNACFLCLSIPQPLGDRVPWASTVMLQDGFLGMDQQVTPGRGLSLELQGPNSHAASSVMAMRLVLTAGVKHARESGPFGLGFPTLGLLPKDL